MLLGPFYRREALRIGLHRRTTDHWCAILGSPTIGACLFRLRLTNDGCAFPEAPGLPSRLVNAVTAPGAVPSSRQAISGESFVTATVARLESAGTIALDDLTRPPPFPPVRGRTTARNSRPIAAPFRRRHPVHLSEQIFDVAIPYAVCLYLRFTLNGRFSARVSHFLFEAEFCNPASG
jgi:hypothetical protein